MKLKDQVVSLEIAQRLRELGVKQESLFWWKQTDSRKGFEWVAQFGKAKRWDNYSAFTVAELYQLHYERFGLCNIPPKQEPNEVASHLGENLVIKIQHENEKNKV